MCLNDGMGFLSKYRIRGTSGTVPYHMHRVYVRAATVPRNGHMCENAY